MSISSRITEMEGHIENVYNMLEVGGADLTNVNKNILNIDAQLKDRYLDYLNNGTDEIWNNWEKVTATNVNAATLNNTVEAPMRIELKGNTSQGENPSPSNPQVIHNVSGNNNIKIENKNIFGVSFQRGNWNTNGTYNEQSSTTTIMSTPKFTLKAGTYFVSNSKITNWQWYILKWSGNSWTATQKNAPSSFTLNEDALISFQFNGPKGNGVAVEPYLEELTEYMMLEYNSTATSYVAHQEQNLPFNLKSRNLFDKNNFEYVNGKRLNDNGEVVTDSNSSYSITLFSVKPNMTYTIQGTQSITNKTTRINFYDINKTFISRSNAHSQDTYSFIIPENCYYIGLQLRDSTYINLDIIQLEEGTTATTYEPYYNYELCKIDTAQDYFYKDSGKWYIHKETFKLTLKGTETYVKNSEYTNAYSFIMNSYRTQTSTASATNLLCNIMTAETSNNANTTRIVTSNGNTVLNFAKDYVTYDVDALKTKITQLYNNGTPIIILLPLKTPKNTEITDATLISQLEALLQSKSYNDQTNISQTNDDLPFILDITALKNS